VNTVPVQGASNDARTGLSFKWYNYEDGELRYNAGAGREKKPPQRTLRLVNNSKKS